MVWLKVRWLQKMNFFHAETRLPESNKFPNKLELYVWKGYIC